MPTLTNEQTSKQVVSQEDYSNELEACYNSLLSRVVTTKKSSECAIESFSNALLLDENVKSLSSRYDISCVVMPSLNWNGDKQRTNHSQSTMEFVDAMSQDPFTQLNGAYAGEGPGTAAALECVTTDLRKSGSSFYSQFQSLIHESKRHITFGTPTDAALSSINIARTCLSNVKHLYETLDEKIAAAKTRARSVMSHASLGNIPLKQAYGYCSAFLDLHGVYPTRRELYNSSEYGSMNDELMKTALNVFHGKRAPIDRSGDPVGGAVAVDAVIAAGVTSAEAVALGASDSPIDSDDDDDEDEVVVAPLKNGRNSNVFHDSEDEAAALGVSVSPVGLTTVTLNDSDEDEDEVVAAALKNGRNSNLFHNSEDEDGDEDDMTVGVKAQSVAQARSRGNTGATMSLISKKSSKSVELAATKVTTSRSLSNAASTKSQSSKSKRSSKSRCGSSKAARVSFESSPKTSKFPLLVEEFDKGKKKSENDFQQCRHKRAITDRSCLHIGKQVWLKYTRNGGLPFYYCGVVGGSRFGNVRKYIDIGMCKSVYLDEVEEGDIWEYVA